MFESPFRSKLSVPFSESFVTFVFTTGKRKGRPATQAAFSFKGE